MVSHQMWGMSWDQHQSAIVAAAMRSSENSTLDNAKGLEELHDRPLLAAGAEAGTQGRVVGKPQDRRRQRGRIAGRDQQCAFAVSARSRGCRVRPPQRSGVRRTRPGDAERQRQGHGPVSRTLRRYPGPGCARRHDVRRRRLARRARPHRPRQRHLGAVAALQSRTSTPSSGFGSTYANASYRSASSTTPRPSSTPVAKHGSTSSQNRIVCEPSAPIHGS